MDSAPSDKEVKRLLVRRDKAYHRKQQWQSLLQQTYRYSQPNRNTLDITSIGNQGGTSNTAQGTNLNWYVYDLTCAHGTEVYVNRMINALIPPGKKWIFFEPGEEIPDEFKDEVQKACQKLTNIFFTELNRSNFNLVAYECFMDMAVSTGYMIINEGKDEDHPFICASMPPYVTYASEGPYSTFDAYYRDFVDLPITHAEAMWSNFSLPDAAKQQDKVDPTLTLYEVIYKDYTDDKWHYSIIDSASHKVCYSRIDETCPAIGFRSKKLSGEVDGRGPAMDCMPAAATINQALHDEIQAANFQAQPTYLGFDDGVFNPYTFKMAPNTIISCSPPASGTWPITPLPPSGDVSWTALVLNDLREQINRILLTDPFGPMDAPKQTATEIIARQQQIMENGSASFARIQREFFEPVVERIIAILRKKNKWTEVKADGKIIDIKFVTPLTMSEDQREVLQISDHHQIVASMFGPEAAGGFYNIEKVSPWLARKLDVDLSLVKSEQQLLDMFEDMQDQRKAEIEQTQISGEAA